MDATTDTSRIRPSRSCALHVEYTQFNDISNDEHSDQSVNNLNQSCINDDDMPEQESNSEGKSVDGKTLYNVYM